MSLAQNAVSAKSRAVFGERLTAEDYSRLASAETVGDVCEQLKRTQRYGAALQGVNSWTIHRGHLEDLLKAAVFDIYGSFRAFDFSSSRGYFRFTVMRLEIVQIISAISAVISGTSDRYIASMPMFLNKYCQVDLPALSLADDLGQASEIIRGTPYEKPLGKFLETAAEEGTLDISKLESILSKWYYSELLRFVEKSYHGGERRELKTLVLKCADMDNVVMMYRRARFAGISQGEAREAMIPFRYRLSDDEICELVKEKDVEKIAGELEKRGYRANNTNTVELMTDSISLKFLASALHRSQSPSAVYFALSRCLALELDNVKTLIEGVRYKMDGSEIMKMLVI